MGIKIVMMAVNDVDKHVLGANNEILYIYKIFFTRRHLWKMHYYLPFVSGNLFADDNPNQ